MGEPTGDSVKGFLRHAMAAAIPLSVHWDLTWRCDHRCVHCYLTHRRQPELSFAECLDVLDQLAAAGTMMLLISGGDPFLRPDAVDIIRAARKRGFDVRINTHGNFIDDAVADALAEVGVSRVALSVYSATPAAHEAITLVPGSHIKTLAAARRLIARGVPVRFKTPVMLHNRLEYREVGPLAEAMGASWELDAHLVPDDDSDFGLCRIGLHPTDRVLAMLTDLDRSREHVEPVATLPDAPSEARTCSAGTASGYLAPDGGLYACINWRERIGSVREAPFAALWQGGPVIDRLREVRRASYLGDCGGCAFHGKCGYCPGLSHAETGDAGRRSAYVCERTHQTMSAIEHMNRLRDEGAPVPAPDSPEAEALLARSTFADRQWAARRAGLARPADAVPLVTIHEPR
ncbi:MAG: radical SAM protein [Myxococcales bacterium]|nr:radical SAM protein [Myxococcales bacterium]